MADLDINYVRKNLEQKSTNQLIDIISFTQEDYKPEIIPIIEEILISRGVHSEEISERKKSYSKLMGRIDKQKFIPKYKTPIIITIIMLVIASYLERTIVPNLFKTTKTSVQQKGWTTGYTDSMRNILINSEGFKLIPTKYQSAFCDCYIDKLKLRYPNRVKTSITGAIIDTLISECADKVKADVK